jgi:predicted NBD/HSP70 family sugar kinase
MAQFAFGQANGASNLVTVLVNDSIGVGAVLDGAVYHSGGEIGYLRTASSGTDESNLETYLSWASVEQRATALQEKYTRSQLPGDRLTYLHIRHAVSENDPAALALQDELAGYLAQIFAWVIALLRPDHISLAGAIADMGDALLECAVEKTKQRVLPDLMRTITFSLTNASNLVAIGAVARTLQQELGLV